MKKMVYITNLNLSESSGGGSAVNVATLNQLSSSLDIKTIHSISPPQDKWAKLKSVFLRKLAGKGNYHFYSNRRLNKIASQVEDSLNNIETYDSLFFHGFTPWISFKPDKPYYAFNDACFGAYVTIYNNRASFSELDLKRIFNLEKEWLNNAEKVFFRSQWAVDETREYYRLEGKHFFNVGLGGFIDIPEKDTYKGEKKDFLFISREFIPKGGKVVFEAFKKLKLEYPEIGLTIVGEEPPNEIASFEGVNYLGFLNKNKEEEKSKLIEVFSSTFALIHPTLKDTNSLVVTELAYYGSPVISSNLFAIPEYVKNGESGFLLDNPRDVDELCKKMKILLEDENLYKHMRRTSFLNSRNNTWDLVGHRLLKHING